MLKTHAVYAVAGVLEAEDILAKISQQTFRDIDAGEVQVWPPGPGHLYSYYIKNGKRMIFLVAVELTCELGETQLQ